MNNKNSNFVFANHDTVELAEKFGTPLYVISQNIIEERCKEVRESFLHKYDNTSSAYASKAFLTMAMCKIIEKQGLGLDVVSGGELYTAVKSGFPMKKVIFHGNNKSYDELYLAIENNVGRIIVDNFHELYLIDEISNKLNKVVNVLYRIIPGVNSKTHKYITTGHKDSKFGITLKDGKIFEAIKKAQNCKYIRLLGFHFHVGSQILDNTSHILAVEKTIELVKEAKDRLGFYTKEVNTGGGYGIVYTKDDANLPLSYFTDAIMEKVYEKCQEYELEIPTIVIEPGRWIIGEAGITIYKVGSIKEIPDVKTYVAINGGMTDNIRPALYDAEYEAEIANKYNKEKNETVTVVGKCCESGDVIINNLKVPSLESGDLLVVFGTGAYNYSMASNYNKIPRPAVVLVNDEEASVIVERETYEDLLSKDIIPGYLE